MKKRQAVIFLTIMFALTPISAKAATENDLREVIGLERMEGEEWERTAAAVLAQCTGQERYNELVDELKYVEDEEAQIIRGQVQQKEAYCSEYMDKFLAGKPAEELTESLSGYNRICKQLNQTAAASAVAGDLEYYDTAAIENQLTYANAILALCKSTANIGEIGQDADTFLLTGLSIQKLTEDALTCSVTPKMKIYAQFNGIVTKISGNTVEIKSGNATIFTYRGIKAKSGLSAGATVRQYSHIGNAVGSSVTVTMQSGVRKINPLKLYGQKATYWLENYLRAQPWDGYALDLDDIKNEVCEEESDPAASSVMTNESGRKTSLKNEDSRQENTAETILESEALEYFFPHGD